MVKQNRQPLSQRYMDTEIEKTTDLLPQKLRLFLEALLAIDPGDEGPLPRLSCVAAVILKTVNSKFVSPFAFRMSVVVNTAGHVASTSILHALGVSSSYSLLSKKRIALYVL